MKRYNHVSGVLLLYMILIGIYIIYSFTVFINIIKSLIINTETLGILILLHRIILVILFSISLYLIFKKKFIAIKFNIITLWIEFILGVLFFVGSYIFLPVFRTSPSLLQIGLFTFGSIIWTVLWSVYFLISERVKDTLIK